MRAGRSLCSLTGAHYRTITGLREKPIEDLTFSNIHIDAQTGFRIANAKGVVFLDSVIDTAKGPAVILNNATQIETARLSTRNPHADVPMVQDESSAGK